MVQNSVTVREDGLFGSTMVYTTVVTIGTTTPVIVDLLVSCGIVVG